MSLASSMKKVTSFTNKLVNITRSSQLGVDLPVNALTSTLGFEESWELGSVEGIANTIKDLQQGISTTATMAYCATTLFTIKGGLEFLDRLALGADSAIASILDQVIDAVATQISMAAQQVIGSFTSLLDALANLVQSVLLIADALTNLWDSWTNWAEWKFKIDIDKKACMDMYAAIAGCLLNKYLGPYLEDFTSKIVGKINEVGNNFNDALYDSLSDVNTFTSYSKQESFLLKKASIQIKGLTKENLLNV